MATSATLRLPVSDGGKRLSWPAVAVLGGYGLWQTWFFMSLDGGGWVKTATALTVTAWYGFLLVMILRGERAAFWRRVFFVSIALLFFPSFMGALVDERGSVVVGSETIASNETPFCHIVTPMIIIPALLQQGLIFPARLSGHYASVYSMLAIWLVATLTIGRGWCSWVCFFGGWDDGLSRAAKRPRLELSNAPAAIRHFSFAMLGFVVLGSMVSLAAVYCEWLCPFKLVTEFAPITGFLSLLATIFFILGFFGFVVVLPLLTRRRFQCASFCPFGAFQSLLDRFSIYRVGIDSAACSGCLKCVRVCPTLSVTESDIKKGRGRTGITCTKCGECVDACPRGACSYQFRHAPLRKAAELAHGARKPLKAWAGRLPRPLAAGWGLAERTVADILTPRALFATTAFIFGMVMSSGFAPETLERTINWLAGTGFVLASGG